MKGNGKNRRSRAAEGGLFCALLAAVMLSGCGRVRTANRAGQAESETASAQSIRTNTVRLIAESESETDTEAETQKLITSVDYTSKDGTVKITLPDNTWKVTQDADEMRVFSSGNDAMINIVHASTDAALKTLSIQTSKENLEAALLKQYSEPSAYQIESYEKTAFGNVNIYRYVVKYNADARMWAYSVTYGIEAPDQAYVITGTVTDDNQALLKAVEDSVDSFSVLKDEELKSVTDSRTSGVTAAGQSTSAAAPAASQTAAQQSVMYASEIANIRSGPGTDSAIVGAVAAGDKVTITGQSNGWYQVSVNGTVGYIRGDLLTATQTTTPTTPQTPDSNAASAASASAAAEIATGTDYSSASTLYTTDGVNIRSNPGTDSSVLATLGTGSAVTVIGETDNWYIVSTGAGRGYISKAYLSQTAPSGGNSSGTSGGSSSGTSGGNTSGGNSSGSGTSSGGNKAPTSGSSTISGTVTGATASTVTVAGDDGNTYTIYTGDADISTADGLYSGLRITASVDNSQTASDGTRYATSVTGE